MKLGGSYIDLSNPAVFLSVTPPSLTCNFFIENIITPPSLTYMATQLDWECLHLVLVHVPINSVIWVQTRLSAWFDGLIYFLCAQEFN